MGTRQWKRVAQVIIGKAGTGLLVTDLRIQFEIMKTVDATPNTAVVRMYNLHPDHEAKIKNEFDEAQLFAGYVGALQLLFRGNLTHVYRYRDGNDYITELEIGDGDKDFRQAVMNETLAAGTTVQQLVERAVGSFQSVGGTTKGAVQIAGTGARTRGKVLSGNTRDVLHNAAREANANWSIQDGQLTMVGVNDVLPHQAIVLRADTGLLGAPEISDKGIVAKCLLNPQLRVNGAVMLDNNGIKAKRQKAAAKANSAAPAQEPTQPVRLDPDGVYKVLQVTHKGDTRGQDWTSEVECIGLDQPIPASRSGMSGGLGG